MKLIPYLLIAATVFLICSTATGQYIHPAYVNSIPINRTTQPIPLDSLHIVTPEVEIYFMQNNVIQPRYDKRELVKEAIIQTLKSELNYYRLKGDRFVKIG